jgi:hypothetical protein
MLLPHPLAYHQFYTILGSELQPPHFTHLTSTTLTLMTMMLLLLTKSRSHFFGGYELASLFGLPNMTPNVSQLSRTVCPDFPDVFVARATERATHSWPLRLGLARLVKLFMLVF